jgi:hypothetical protein
MSLSSIDDDKTILDNLIKEMSKIDLLENNKFPNKLNNSFFSSDVCDLASIVLAKSSIEDIVNEIFNTTQLKKYKNHKTKKLLSNLLYLKSKNLKEDNNSLPNFNYTL